MDTVAAATEMPSGSRVPTSPTLLARDRWWHIGFGGILTIALIFFGIWSFGYVGTTGNKAILLVTIAFGVFMAFNIGGNDVANSFGTSVGAGTLTIKQALCIAAVFEVSGAVIAGGSVTETVRSGIVDLDHVALVPDDFVFIMMAALLGAAIWLLVATKRGWPVSTTHAIIGGIVGASLMVSFLTGQGSLEMVQWGKIGEIAVSWLISPILGGVASYIIFGAIKRNILVYNDEVSAQLREVKHRRDAHRRRHRERYGRLTEIQRRAYSQAIAHDAGVFMSDNPDPKAMQSDYFRELVEIDAQAKGIDVYRALEIWVPLFAAAGSVVVTSMMLFKGLHNLHLGMSTTMVGFLLVMMATIVWMAVSTLVRSLKKEDLSRTTFVVFSWMQVFTASVFAFSHGSNDIANAVGPFAAVIDVLRTGDIGARAAVPWQLMLVCGVALVSGLWFIGKNVVRTVGEGLTKMHPASGFAAELAAATVVMVASILGIPVSSTHILIGAVLGVGVVNKSANWRLMKPIGLAWIMTLPAAAGIGAISLTVLRVVFG